MVRCIVCTRWLLNANRENLTTVLLFNDSVLRLVCMQVLVFILDVFTMVGVYLKRCVLLSYVLTVGGYDLGLLTGLVSVRSILPIIWQAIADPCDGD